MGTSPERCRAVGSLLAAACGDALGVPYEFGSRPLAPGEDPQMLGGGLGPYECGEYSDDTQMAVVIAQVAAERDLRRPDALDEVVEGWICWLQRGARDVGTQTRQVLSTAARGSAETGAATRARAAALRLHEQTGRTGGNGSLMRTGPVALAFLDDADAVAEVSRRVSSLTHPDPMAGDACVLWCQTIRTAILAGGDSELRDQVRWLPESRRRHWHDLIDEAEVARPETFVPNGYAPKALQAAWSAIRHPVDRGHYAGHPLTASLCAAVHAGDDTDTVAAITGALVGARWGADALPKQWLEVVHGWPGLDADGLRRLALSVLKSPHRASN